MEQAVSKYRIFCMVVESGSFTRTAAEIGYSQPAVSQIIKSLEQQLNTKLILRKRDKLELTADGEVFYPYLRTAALSEEAIERRRQELEGLENSVIRIGSFTSVTRSLLPKLMSLFKKEYPNVRFVLKQGTYTEIQRWIQEGIIDFGFNHQDAVTSGTFQKLYQDEMLAVLPMGHRLAKKKTVSLKDLIEDPFILLDEGEYSATLHAFETAGLKPMSEYTVYDDYTIMAMVRQGLGISMLYQPVIDGFEAGLEIRTIRDMEQRTVGIVSQDSESMPIASRRFVSFILKNTGNILGRTE
jgi:DNA-binding transcriptional LysR family regulator